METHLKTLKEYIFYRHDIYCNQKFTTNSKGLGYYAEGTGHDKAFGVKPENLEIINLFS